MGAVDARSHERLRRLLSDAPGVLVAYLYGSHPRGRVGPLSDVDVALLLNSNDEERGLELAAELAHVDAPPALSYRVSRDGKILTSRDDRARVQHWVRSGFSTGSLPIGCGWQLGCATCSCPLRRAP